jgi:hypothetical protein
LSKVLASVFWDKDGILLLDYLGKGATIMAKSYYIALLDKLKQQLASKRRGTLSKGILFLPDNVALHKVAITHQNLEDLHFQVQKHPAYSTEMRLQTTVSIITSRNTSREESSQH